MLTSVLDGDLPQMTTLQLAAEYKQSVEVSLVTLLTKYEHNYIFPLASWGDWDTG